MFAASSRWRAAPTPTAPTASSSSCSRQHRRSTANTLSGARSSRAWNTSTRSRKATPPATAPSLTPTRSSECRSRLTRRRRVSRKLSSVVAPHRRANAGPSLSPLTRSKGGGERLSGPRAASGWLSALAVYREPRLIAVLLMGFSSGLPLALTGATLYFWLAELGVSLVTIGFFSLVGISYNFKFLWSPLIDRLPIPLLTARIGRRRSW